MGLHEVLCRSNPLQLRVLPQTLVKGRILVGPSQSKTKVEEEKGPLLTGSDSASLSGYKCPGLLSRCGIPQ